MYLVLKTRFLRAYKDDRDCLPDISFSRCGTFAYLSQSARSSRNLDWFHVVHSLNPSPVISRIIEHYIDGIEGLWSKDYQLQLEYINRNSMALTMTRPSHREPYSPIPEPVAILKDFVLLPSHLHPTQRYLLLGNDDNTKMRMLFVPYDGSAPEILPLHLHLQKHLPGWEQSGRG